jgi:Phage phiEco32-like COOH.NH2 ligase-type 2
MRLGADPEVFLQNTKGKLISSIGFINADKWNPMQIPDMPKGFTLQEDNVTLEYGIPPASSKEEYASFIKAVMDKSLDYVEGLIFSNLSCALFEKDQMRNPRALIFGCEPDMNAWSGKYNPPPKPPHKFMRSAGGHIHVETDLCSQDLVKAMDFFLGVPSVLLDSGTERRSMYGKAGAYRDKPYGVEYRTLSNFWIFKEDLIHWVWDQTALAVEFVRSGNSFSEEEGQSIVECINNSDVTIARNLLISKNL